jgi:hypothetical protein
MFKGKKTLLFWCGLFVLIIGIISLFGEFYALSIVLPHENLSNMWLGTVWTFIVWIIIWSISIAIGLYIMKSGVKKEARAIQ